MLDVLRGGRLAPGPLVEEFERTFADHLGCRHAVALSSCTAALHLAYLGCGVGPGDEVVVPSFTFAATANAVLYCGGTPVFADIVGPQDLSIDPADVARKITPRTKAVTSVHFGGYAAPVVELAELCAERGLALVEDAAHAPDATLDGRKLGTFGRAGCFSFFSNKVLSVGEGGLLATDDDELAARARRLREEGHDYRMDEPRAALLLSRLPRLAEDIRRRREHVHAYRERLDGVEGLTVPFSTEGVDSSSCYVMPTLLSAPEGRSAFRQALRERGVQTSILYPATHEFTVYRERFPGVSLPRTERAALGEVTLPLFPHMTGAEHDRVVEAVTEALA